jgi:hypothetical protein
VSLVVRALVRRETTIDSTGPRVKPIGVTVTKGATSTTVVVPFDVGENGALHLNSTGGCTACCNASAPSSSPVALVDPDAPNAPVVHATSFAVDSAAGTLTASFPGWQSTSSSTSVPLPFEHERRFVGDVPMMHVVVVAALVVKILMLLWL